MGEDCVQERTAVTDKTGRRDPETVKTVPSGCKIADRRRVPGYFRAVWLWKSMTLKSIAGIVTPDEGLISIQKGTEQRILFDKSRKVNIKPQKRRIGYLFQNYALFPNMTVQENIAAGLAGDVKNPKVGEMIGRFGLSGLEKQYPGQLSGGQQQRTALARILAYEPDALLLDRAVFGDGCVSEGAAAAGAEKDPFGV